MSDFDFDFVRDFFGRLELEEPIYPSDDRYQRIYDQRDLSQSDPIESLANTIRLSPRGSAQLFSGFRGTGKSTELRRLKEDLESSLIYKVALCDMRQYLNMSMPLDIGGLLLDLAGALSDALEEEGYLGTDAPGESFWMRLPHLLNRSGIGVDDSLFEHGVLASKSKHELVATARAAAYFKVNFSKDPSFRDKVQRRMRLHLGSFVDEVHGFVQDCLKALRARYGEDTELVILVDSMEQIRGTSSNHIEVINSIEAVFGGHADKLRILGVHLVYTAPPWLHLKARSLGEFKNNVQIPCIKLETREGERCEAGHLALAELARRRGDWERLLGNRAAFERLIEATGGRIRGLFRLLQICLRLAAENRELPILEETLELAIEELRSDYRQFTNEDALWLDRIEQTRDVPLDSENDIGKLAHFFDTSLVLGYRNGSDWYAIHPLIRDLVKQRASDYRRRLQGGESEEESERAGERAPRPLLSREVVHLDHISLRNFRMFGELQISPVQPAEEVGQWIILLGENGSGKSSVLAALVFALGLVDDPGYLPSEVFLSRWRKHGLDLEDECSVAVEATGHRWQTGFELVDERELLQRRAGGARTQRPPLFAYGARRGSALGGADREVSFGPGEEISTLFGESGGLVHAETWLIKRAASSLAAPDGGAAKVWKVLTKVLTDLLPDVDDIVFRDGGIWFEGARISPTRAYGLSDGYLTTLGWALDLMARWIELAERRGEEVPPDFHKRMTGLVLIDEIDLHLHPRWQTEVIAQVREIFPRMSFVVTTHNPLTLLGAKEGEVFILKWETDDEGVLHPRALQQDLPPGIRADQVLTGEWFGLVSTRDPETLGYLEQHYEHLRERRSPTDSERRRVEDELHQRLEGFPGTTLEQLIRQLAAEHLKTNFPKLDPQQMQEAREALSALLQEKST